LDPLESEEEWDELAVGNISDEIKLEKYNQKQPEEAFMR
jgi:hypothetical protein